MFGSSYDEGYEESYDATSRDQETIADVAAVCAVAMLDAGGVDGTGRKAAKAQLKRYRLAPISEVTDD